MLSFITKLAGVTAVGLGGSYYAIQQQQQHQQGYQRGQTVSAAAAPPADAATRRQNLSIYDQPTASTTLVPVKSPLQDQVGEARYVLLDSYEVARKRVREGTRAWIGFETEAEARVKSILSQDESLTPGGLYVAIATLTGSIVAKNRNILLRLALPSAFCVAALSHFLPRTASNLANVLRRFEDENAQPLKNFRDGISARLRRD